MGKICKVTFNKETFYANCGDLLLDSAISNGVEMPHDCRSGICGSCKVRVVDGKLFGGTEGDMAHACQARVVSDLNIVTEPVPDTVTMQAEVGDLARLAPDVMGVTLDLPKPLIFFQDSTSRCNSAVSRPAATARPIRWPALRITACSICTFASSRAAWSPPRWGATSRPAIASR